MRIDNGQFVSLVIDGVFDGDAGMSRGELAFVPNRTGRKPEWAKTALLDGQAVRIAVTRQGNICTAQVLP